MAYNYIFNTIVPMMLLLATFSGYKFFFDDYDPFNNNSRVIIAHVENPRNTVKLKANGLIAWIDAHKGQKLGVDDKIYTYEDSITGIKFKSGTSISLAENTLFKIGRDKNNMDEVSVEKGMIYASLDKKNPNLKITLQGRTYNLRSTNAKIQITHSKKKSHIVIVEGKATVKSKGKSSSLAKNQALKYDQKSKQEKIVTIPIALLYPKDKHSIFHSGKPSLNFSWSSAKSRSKYRWVISKHHSFSSTVIEREVDANKVNNIYLPDGKYYWKVEKIGIKNSDSVIRSFSLYQDRAPEMIAPLNNFKILQVTTQKDQSHKIFFEWKKIESTEGYQLKIIDPENSSKVIECSKNNKLHKIYNSGKYRWQVRINDKNRPNSPWSSPLHFQIKEIELPDPPTQISPRDQFKMTLYDLEDEELILKWIPVPGVNTYELIISKDSTKHVIIDKKLTTNQFRWKIENPGIYFWQIRSIDPHGNNTRFSPNNQMTIKLLEVEHLQPQDGTKIELNRPNQEVKFEWKESKSQNQGKQKIEYLFEVAATNKFKKILQTKKTKEKALKTSFKKIGVFYWRTRIITQDKLKGTKIRFSKPRKVIVEPAPPPPSPNLIPEQNLEIKIKDIDKKTSQNIQNIKTTILNYLFPVAHAANFVKFVELEWPTSKDAKEYILEIYSDKKLEKRVLKKHLKEAYFEWSNPQEGDYYWRVAIVDYWDRQTEFSKRSKINVILPDKLKTLTNPSLKYPNHNQQLLPQKTTFKWIGDKRTDRFLYKLASDINFKNILVENATKKRQIRINLSKFKYYKKLYWKIISKDRYKRSVSSKRRRIYIQRKKKKSVKKKRSTRSLPNTTFLSKKNYYQVAYNPSKTSYKSSGTTHKTDISGMALNALKIEGQNLISAPYSSYAAIERTSGKVFDKQSLSFLSIRMLASRKVSIFQSPIQIYAGIGIDNLSYYKYLSDTALEDSTVTKISLQAMARYEHQISRKYSNVFSFGAGLGSMSSLQIRYDLLYFLSSKTYLNSGLSYLGRSFNEEKDEVSISQLQLAIGMGRFY